VVDFKLLEGYRGRLFVWDEKRHNFRFLFAGPATVGVRIAQLLKLPYRFEVD
jgi:hypothetical protein